MPLIGSYFCFVAVFRLITPYSIIMKIASIAKPNGYSGMGGVAVVVVLVAAGMTVKSTHGE